ncbi:MAG: hypothetical protein ACLQPN_24420 [Bryobacteraceae bacterium]
MSSNARIFSFLVLTLAALSGCSSGPAAKESKKAAVALDRIQGKALVGAETGATDAALNAGGPTVYIREGDRRYRLFLRTAADVVDGKEYVAEGIYAQKAIDAIGDPDQGKNGYPLQSSCERVVRMAWSDLAFDEIDADSSLVSARLKRYPARAIFLVTRIRLASPADTSAAEPKTEAAAEEEDVPEVSVPAEKERTFLIAGPTVQTAPLWDPAGGTVNCKVLISSEGKISELETGVQLCEAVPWSQFSYQPPVQGGHPVKVKTEVEVRFDPRK